MREALATDRPLREIWNVCIHTADGRLITEFMALAHRIPGLREDVTHYITESRAIEIGALEVALRRTPAASKLPPPALAIFATSVALTLIRERQLGIDTGHVEVISVIEGFLGETEAS